MKEDVTMAWNSRARNVGFDEVLETIFVNLKLPKNDFNKENIKFMIGGVADRGLYRYASKEAINLIQTIAPDYITERGIRYGNKKELRDKLTIEHSVPNVYVINYLYDLHESISREELSSVLKSLECTIITKEENDRLNKRYKTTMPDGWKFGDNIFVRYEKMDIEIINIAK